MPRPRTAGFTSADLDTLRTEIAAFARDRRWGRYHTVRNLLLALVSEVGEAADLVRWAGDRAAPVAPADRTAWRHELADIAILLIRLADRSDVDLTAAIREKLAVAARKYPVARFRGSNRKYDRQR
jgi:dCTP diphosphatase